MNRMKQLVLLLTCLFLAMTSAAQAENAAGVTWNQYQLEDAGLTVTLPDVFTVFWPGMTGDEPALQGSGLTADQVSETLLSQGILLHGVLPDASGEVYIRMEQVAEVEDFSAQTEQLMKSMLFGMKMQLESVGMKLNQYDIYDHDQVRFLCIRVTDTADPSLDILQYYTIYQGKAINLVYTSFAGAMTQDEKMLMQIIVDSTVFE